MLRVDTQSSGWEKSITKVIKSIKGNNLFYVIGPFFSSRNVIALLFVTYIFVIIGIVDVSFNIDATHGIIRISGAIDPMKLLTEIKKAGKHAELIAADISGSNNNNNGGSVVGHSHPNSNHRTEYKNNEYNGNHSSRYGYGYNEYDGRHGNVIPCYSYNHNQYHSDPYQYNVVLAPHAPSASEQMQLQHYYDDDTNNNCVIMWSLCWYTFYTTI